MVRRRETPANARLWEKRQCQPGWTIALLLSKLLSASPGRTPDAVWPRHHARAHFSYLSEAGFTPHCRALPQSSTRQLVTVIPSGWSGRRVFSSGGVDTGRNRSDYVWWLFVASDYDVFRQFVPEPAEFGYVRESRSDARALFSPPRLPSVVVGTSCAGDVGPPPSCPCRVPLSVSQGGQCRNPRAILECIPVAPGPPGAPPAVPPFPSPFLRVPLRPARFPSADPIPKVTSST